MAKVAKRFVQALQGCPNDVQAHAITILRELAADPIGSASIHKVTPDSRAVSPDVYKVRLNDNFRLVLQRITRPKLEWLPVFAGKHEAVDRFIVRYQPVVDAEDKITILPAMPEAVESAKPTVFAHFVPPERGLFDPWADVDLRRAGVPEDAITVVRTIRSEDEIEGLRNVLPGPAFETLEDWATAPSERERAAILGLASGTHRVADAESLGSILECPENYEEVVELQDPADLMELIEKAPMEDWMLYLHPDQRAIVDRDFNGPSRIRGVSGSGKTVILAHRARRLARLLCKGQNDRILVATHNRVLADLLRKRLLPKLCGPEFYYIDVDTVHGWAAQYLEGPRVDFRRAEECLEEALATVRREHPDARILQRPVSFFQEEISQVIRGRLLADLPSYQELQRRGRGTPLNSEQRTMVWKVFEEYVRLRSRNHVLDADDLLQGALYRLMGPKGSGVRGQIDAELFAQQGPAREGHNYLAVLVDEAQDLTELGLHLVYAIAGDRPNGLFLVGDGLQKIYKGGFSLRRFGIDIHGRALVLKKNFRNTRAIMAAAYALVSELEFEDFDEEAKTKAYPPEFSARTGEKPIIAKCRDIEHEATWIAKTIQDLRDRVGVRAGDIAVLYRGEPYRAAVAGALEKAGIEHVFHREDHFLDEDAVRVSTVHSTKGMEFRAVLIAGLTERIFPWAGIDPQTATEEEKRAHIELQLRLLYVAMTRARDFLFLTYPMLDRNSNVLQPSWFLNRIRDFCMFHDAVSQPAFA